MKAENFKHTEELFEKIKSIGFFERLFSWKNIISLTLESYNEFKNIDKNLSNLEEIKTKLQYEIDSLKKDLKHNEKEKDNLEKNIFELKTEGKNYEKIVNEKTKIIAKLSESEDKNKKRLDELNSDYKIITDRYNELLSKNKENEKKISVYEKDEKRKQEDYEHKVTELNSLKKQLEDDRIRIQDEREQEIKQKFEEMKKTWKEHEINVEQNLKQICNKYTIEYIDKENVPFKGKPDNTLKIANEYIIFDSKSPSSDDLNNFPSYIKNQAEQVKKYIKEKDVKKDIFLVIPTNTLGKITNTFFNMTDYRVFVISTDSIEPIILSLKKIEDYETVAEINPEDREHICRVIGKFAHTTKRRLQIDSFFADESINLLKSCEKLPKTILDKSIEIEMSAKLNPPMEKRTKQIDTPKLTIENKKRKKELEIHNINTKIDREDIEKIRLYED
jgi:hypothetical protein